MRILYVTHTKDGSGARIALCNNIKFLVRKGHEVYVIVPSEESKVSENAKEVGASVIVAPVSLTLYPRTKNPVKWVYRLLRNIYLWEKAKSIIEKSIILLSIDIVHTNVGPMSLAFSICKKNKIPHVWHQREFFDKYSDSRFFPCKKLFYKYIHDPCNYNICITRQIFDYYKLDNNGHNIVIYDGVFTEIPNLIHGGTKQNIILSIGRIEENKSQYQLLIAFIKLQKKDPTLKLKLIGGYSESDKYYQKCKKLVSDSNIEDNVEFLGIQDCVYRYIQQAKVVAVMSKFEGFGFVTVEAMINKTVVVGRDSTGTKEQFDIGKKIIGSDIAYRFNNEEELQQALIAALYNDNTSMVNNAYKVAINNYSTEISATNLEKFYYSIIKK